MNIRRTTAIGSAAALALAVALVPTAAHAAPYCSIDITLPKKIVINDSETTYDATVASSPKACLKSAAYELDLDGSSQGTLVFSGAGTEVFTVQDTSGPGEYTASFSSGTDKYGDPVLGLDSEQSAIAKWGTRTTLSVQGRGDGAAAKLISVSALAEQWGAQYHDYDPAYRTSVSFQVKGPGGWQTLKTVKTSRKGVATAVLNVKTTAIQRIRAVSSEDGARWGSKSGVAKG